MNLIYKCIGDRAKNGSRVNSIEAKGAQLIIKTVLTQNKSIISLVLKNQQGDRDFNLVSEETLAGSSSQLKIRKYAADAKIKEVIDTAIPVEALSRIVGSYLGIEDYISSSAPPLF